MKNLMCLIALSFALILTACSNTEQDIISPISPQLEKGNVEIRSFPYQLYETLPELKSARVTWKNRKEGLLIVNIDMSVRMTNKYLFAIIEYVDAKGSTMAFLGDTKSSKYYLNGFNEKEISSISIFFSDVSTSAVGILPYSKSQLFNNHRMKGWADASNYVKVNSYPFSSNMKHLFAQLIASEGNQLIFLGKPQTEDFDFPKSEKLTLKDIKLFTYEK